MQHLLDWWNTKCSCKWGGCKICNASNKLVSLHNDLIKFWLNKEIIRENLKAINSYLDKIDTYTLYEYFSNQITEEEFNEALEKFKPNKKREYKQVKKSEVVDTSWNVNPENKCVFKWNSPWDRCIYCNGIRKYMQWKECSKFKETQGTTDTENK